MSKESVRREMARFLASSDPEVLCISGRWGVGKTYNWTRELFPQNDPKASDRKRVSLSRYGYVSLFGINSLADLKYAVFENTIPLGRSANERTIDVWAARAQSVTEVGSRRVFNFGKQLPVVKKYIGDMGTAWFLLVREQIVCFDDLERRGHGLTIRDVLGLASHLREERKCKVVLILNDEEIRDKNEHLEYRSFLEKVVDVRVRFDPTPRESIAIGASGKEPPDTWIAEDALKLGLSNIRIIKKIGMAYERIAYAIEEFDEEVRRYVVHALAILAYAVYMPDGDKFLTLLKRGDLRRLFEEEGKREYTEQEREWLGMIDVYGFARIDELDEELLKGVRDGYFDEEKVKILTSEMHERVLRERRQETFSGVWNKHYKESFEGDEGEILKLMIEAMKGSIETVSIGSLNAVVAFANDLERNDVAEKAIDIFVEGRRETPDIFDLISYPFSDDISEDDIRMRFASEAAKQVDKRTLRDVLTDMSKERNWKSTDLAKLAAATPEDYRDVFLESQGQNLQTTVYTALQFARIVNATGEMREITERAREGLRMIARTSRLNRHRISKLYGVDLEEKPGS